MSSNRLFKKYQITEFKIDDMAFEGKGISRIPTESGDYIVFTPNTIPGQTVKAKIVKAKANYAEAKLLRVLEKSELETPIVYHPIPGAPYITLPIDVQRDYKRKTTIELFRRIGKVENAEALLDEFIPSPNDFHYRNKMEYSFSSVVYDRDEDVEYDGFALGFKKRGQWLAVEPMKGDSGMFDRELEEALPRISEYFASRNMTAWNSRKLDGFCRFLTVRKSFSNDELLVNLVTTSNQLDIFDSDEFCNLMKNILGSRLAGLIHTINDDRGDRPNATDGKQHLLMGKAFVTEDISGLKFRISPESFFQTNPASAHRLYNKALDYAFEQESEKDTVTMDLFSGTGTITQLLAQRSNGQEIIGVELSKEATEDARKNAVENGFPNLKFYAADVGRFLYEHPEYQGKIGTLIMDPPRAGIAPKTLRKIIRLNTQRMVYISCNPATQARDIEALDQAGYKLIKYSMVDQFPHTAHVETVALFEKA